MKIFEELEEKEDQLILAFLATILTKNNIKSICDYGRGDDRCEVLVDSENGEFFKSLDKERKH